MTPKACIRNGWYASCIALGLVIVVGMVLAVTAQDLPAPRKAGEPLPKAPDEKRRPPEESPLAPLGVNSQYFEVTVGQSRILTTKVELIAKDKNLPLIAVGDPGILEFNILNPSQIRVVGLIPGITDLSIVTPDKKVYSVEVRVKADLDLLRAKLIEAFPDASVRLVEMREHVIVEGQARDSTQVARIMEAIRAYMDSVGAAQTRKNTPGLGQPVLPPREGAGPIAPLPVIKTDVKFAQPQIINMLKVPGPQQVLLKVRIAELDRTAFRQIGADFLVANPNGSGLVGTQIGGSTVQAKTNVSKGIITDAAALFANTSATTVFGIFDRDFAFMLQALRRNELLKILAEPNLVALNGHKASFLAGGEFPVPIPQTGTGIGGVSPITVEFKKFGVELGFKPDILDNGMIRLAVAPSVSSIDFAIGTTIQGTVVPGLNKRDANTTVEIREGQTLAIAGLLNVTLEGTASRIPGLGDVPVLGPFFSNTTNKRTEKELIVLVTPYLVDALKCDEVPPHPGAEVGGPTDLEFYLHGRIEGRTGDWRATTKSFATPPITTPAYLRLHDTYIRGPHGFSD